MNPLIKTLNTLLNPIEKAIFSASPYQLLMILWLINIVKTGVGFMGDMWHVGLLMAQDPFVNVLPNPISHYLFWNWLGPFLAWCLHIKTLPEIFTMHLLFSIGFTWIMFKGFFKHLSGDAARIALIIFMLLPVSGTAYYWIGKDSITLFFMAVILYGMDSWCVLIIAGIALGMNHFEQSLFAFGALGVVLMCSRWNAPNKEALKKSLISVLLGIVLGKCVLIALFHGLNIPLRAGRVSFILGHYHDFVKEFLAHAPIMLYSVLGLGWVIALFYIQHEKKVLPFFIVLIGLLTLQLFVDDQTRVLAIITFPLIAVCWLQNETFLLFISKKRITLLCLIWVLMPWIWIWQGISRGTMFLSDVKFFINQF